MGDLSGSKILSLPNSTEVCRTYSRLVFRKIISDKEKKSRPREEIKEYIINYPGSTNIEELDIQIDLNLLPGGKAIEKYRFDETYKTFINFDMIKFPLKIRLPLLGDRFVPLGSMGRKKISDFFIDNKIPSNIRWKIPLLTDNKNIIWIIGYRISELYRIKYECKNVLMVTVIQKEPR
jgi:tRNA(Ile)-lysidine synthase